MGEGASCVGVTWIILAASSSTFGFLTSEPSLPGTKLRFHRVMTKASIAYLVSGGVGVWVWVWG